MTSKAHPLRVALQAQGRSVAWLAGLLGCNRRLLYDRMSGRRSGLGSRGPAAWTPAPVRVVRAAHALQVTPAQLAAWLGVEMEVGHG